MVFYDQGKKWEERFYHGVVGEVGDSVLSVAAKVICSRDWP